MSSFLQQVFNFYFRGGWPWLALVPLVLLTIMLIDNQRRQRQALTWILLLVGCVLVFTPSLFYSLSEGKALTQATREIFYAGILGVFGAVLGMIGYVISFQWSLPQAVTGGFAYPPQMDLQEEDEEKNGFQTTELTHQDMSPQALNIPTIPPPLPPSAVAVSPAPDAFFENVTRGFEPISTEPRPRAPGWLQDLVGHHYPLLRGVTRIGRETDQDVRLPDLSVSRRHAIIRYEQYARGEAFILQAVGQAETALNGIVVGKDPKQLYDGDRIRFGMMELTFFSQTRR